MTSMREQLKQQIATLAEVPEQNISDQTPILQEGYLDSAGLLELIFVIEELTGREIDLEAIQREHFLNIDTICANFGSEIGIEAQETSL